MVMIRSYKGKFAETIHAERKVPKGFPADVAKAARRKLVMINSAVVIEDLRSPPGNRLEQLQGDLRRQALDPHQQAMADRVQMDR